MQLTVTKFSIYGLVRSMLQIFQLIIKVSIFWLTVNVIHILLTKYLGERYNFYLSRNGIFLKFAQIQWHTDRFNSVPSDSFVRSHSSKIAAWFTCGAYLGIIIMFSSVLILIYTFISSFVKETGDSKILTPVVPGVNLPNSQIIPYLLTLLISGIFHEFGHALAAAREGVSMYGSGLFLFLIYPAAFVDLNTQALKRCDAFQRLRIFCAGVWHNCILMVGAYVLWTALPFLLFFFGYVKEHAVTVTSVEPGSALMNQVLPGTKLYSINNCIVPDKVAWGECLWKMYGDMPPGNCVNQSNLPKLISLTDCCEDGFVSPRNICFDSSGGVACLPARQVLKLFPCETDIDCSKGYYCYKPHLKEGHLLQIIHSTSDTKALFIGDPAHLYYSISVSDYSSKYFWSEFPNCIELFLIYVVSLSGALAIFNAVPAFYLDGQHMLNACMELLFDCSKNRFISREMVCFIIQLFSTALIAVNVINAFISVCVMYR